MAAPPALLLVEPAVLIAVGDGTGFLSKYCSWSHRWLAYWCEPRLQHHVACIGVALADGATVLQTDRAGTPLGGILLFIPRFIADVLGLLVSPQRLRVARKPMPAHDHAPAFQRCHSATTSIALLQPRVLVRPNPLC